MAQGTGLPLPKPGNDLAQAPSINADAVSSAAAWTKIAAAGEKVANAGLNLLERDVHLQQAGAVANFENEWRTKNIEARDQFAKDPEGFKNWAQSSIEGAASSVPSWMGPHAKSYLTRTFDGSYASILSERRAQDDHLADESLRMRLKTIDDDVMALTANNKLNTSEGNAAVATYKSVLQTRVDMRRLSPAGADVLLDDLSTRMQGTVIRNQVEQVYRDPTLDETGKPKGGYEAARAYLHKSIDELGVKYSIKDKIRTQTLGWLKSEEAGLRGARDDVRREWSTARPQEKTLDINYLLDIRQRASLAGDLHTVRDISDHIGALDAYRADRNTPESERLTQIKLPSGTSVTVNKQAQSAFSGFLSDLAATGYKLDTVQGFNDRNIAGTNVKSEHAKGFAIDINPDRNPDTGPGGKLVTDLPSNVSELAAKWGLKWGGNFTSKKDAMHFEYVGDGNISNRSALIARKWIIDDNRKSLTADIARLKADDRHFEFPQLNEMILLAQKAEAVGTPEQQETIKSLYAQAIAGAQFAQMTNTERQDSLALYNQKVKEGGADQYMREVGRKASALNEKINKAFKENPYDAGAKFVDGIGATPTIDFDNPEKMKVVVTERLRQQNTMIARGDVDGQISILKPHEVNSLKVRLETASMDQKLATFKSLAALLPEHVYKATMEKLGNDTLTQFVGTIARDRPELAREILHGSDLMTLDKTGDKSSVIRAAFQNKISSELYPSAADQNNVTRAAMAVYTSRRGPSALYDATDSSAIEKAIEDVAGKIVKRNGIKVAVPPGMTEAVFTGALSNMTFEQLARFGGAFDARGLPFNGGFLSDRAVLKQLGPGESNYLVGLPNAQARDGFSPVLNMDGRPLVIDVKQLAANQDATRVPPTPTPYQIGRAALKTEQAQRLQDARRQSLEAQ